MSLTPALGILNFQALKNQAQVFWANAKYCFYLTNTVPNVNQSDLEGGNPPPVNEEVKKAHRERVDSLWASSKHISYFYYPLNAVIATFSFPTLGAQPNLGKCRLWPFFMVPIATISFVVVLVSIYTQIKLGTEKYAYEVQYKTPSPRARKWLMFFLIGSGVVNHIVMIGFAGCLLAGCYYWNCALPNKMPKPVGCC